MTQIETVVVKTKGDIIREREIYISWNLMKRKQKK